MIQEQCSYHISFIYSVIILVEMRPKSLHVTGMLLACNMQGFGTFAMHVCMLCACNMHTTCKKFPLGKSMCKLHEWHLNQKDLQPDRTSVAVQNKCRILSLILHSMLLYKVDFFHGLLCKC